MARPRPIILPLVLVVALLATQATAGRIYVACADGSACAPQRTHANLKVCCGAKHAPVRPAPAKTCVVKTTAGVDAPKPSIAAAPVPTLALLGPALAILPQPSAAAGRADPVADDLPPPQPSPHGAQGPRAPPASA